MRPDCNPNRTTPRGTHMHLQIDHDDFTTRPQMVKALAFFLLHSIGEIPDEEVPEGTTAPKIPAAPSAATSAATATNVASVAATAQGTATTAPAPASNVLPFPVPPPPSNVTAVATNAATADVPALSLAPAPSAAAATGVASAPAEYDAAGIPWDARIHQKAKGKKKDLTWKLIKGIDEAVVVAVVAELAARKIATPASPSAAPAAAPAVPPPPSAVGAVPPPPATVAPQVFLPESNNAGQQNSVPVPPVPSAAPAETVSAPNAPAAGVVPVPPVPAAGPVGVTYRSLIDKMTAGTKAQTLSAAKVLEIVTSCGGANLQQLNTLPQIWADVDAKLDLALAGLL